MLFKEFLKYSDKLLLVVWSHNLVFKKKGILKMHGIIYIW